MYNKTYSTYIRNLLATNNRYLWSHIAEFFQCNIINRYIYTYLYIYMFFWEGSTSKLDNVKLLKGILWYKAHMNKTLGAPI